MANKEVQEMIDIALAKVESGVNDESIVKSDTTDDGKIDTVCVDTDGDGTFDTILFDVTADGKFDNAFVDTVCDGVVDTAVDLDEEGKVQ